jgi:iron complex transport system ATP-binding protein
MQGHKTLLSAHGLSVGYNADDIENILFENLNLDLNQGELVCFMGPNGVGKSTLIRTLAGLHPPIAKSSSGTVFDPKKISVVLTDRVSAANMTVEELVTFGRYPYLDWNIKLNSNDAAFIDRAIELTHIQHLKSKKIFELSDGQLQMAMIARALAQDTPVILLDEPTAHLDLNNRVEIMNLLRKLCRSEEKAILVSTHELDLALQTADLVWLAGLDKKIMMGIPEDLVLDGSFDSVFQFKGFDLKTGKVSHETFRNVSVMLIGEGPKFLWTKNALERRGYGISETSDYLIIVSEKQWTLNGQSFTTIKELLNNLPQD